MICTKDSTLVRAPRAAMAGLLFAVVLGPLGCTYDYAELSGTNRDGAVAGDVSSDRQGTGSGGRLGIATGGSAPIGTGGIGGAGPGSGGGAGSDPGVGGAGGTVGVAGAGGGPIGTGSGGRGGSAGASPVAGRAGTAGLSGTGGAAVGTGGAAGASTGPGGRGGSTGAAGAGTAGRGGSTGSGGANASGGSTGSGGAAGAAGVDPDLVLWYKFDEATGTTAVDSSGAAGGPRNGTLATAGLGGTASFSTVHQVGTRAVSLTSNGILGGGYVVTPSLAVLAPNAMTVSAWVNISASRTWQRVFDGGNSTASNMSLTTSDAANGAVRFVIRVNGTSTEELITTTTALSLSQWHHIVVVLGAGATYTGRIYVDGVLVGSNPAMTLHPGNLVVTTQNYIGRSVFAYPYLPGLVDDFRVYRRALSAAEIAALFTIR